MPIPSPRPDEPRDDFVSRCMGDNTMGKEFPDQKQRAAVCSSKWREHHNQAEIAINAAASAARFEKRGEREFAIIPIVALVEGVLHPSNALIPSLALAEEFARFPAGWDGRPVTMGHPKNFLGFPVHANSPDAWDNLVVGQLHNSRLDGRSLKTEAWIDVARAEVMGGEAKEFVELARTEKLVEVSTGFFASDEFGQGDFKGKRYFSTFRNVVPDHLAILMDSIGACSIDDGCGAFRNSDGSCNEHCLCENCMEKYMTEKKPEKNGAKGSLLASILSHLNLSADKPGHIVIGEGDEAITLIVNPPEKDMTKKDIVTGLIDNEATNFTKDDESWLMELDEKKLVLLVPPKVETKPVDPSKKNEAEPLKLEQPKVEEKKQPMTTEEYIAAAPPEVAAVLKANLEAAKTRRNSFVEAIKTHQKDIYSDEELNALSDTVLEKMARLAAPANFTGRGGPIRDSSKPKELGYTPPKLVFTPDDIGAAYRSTK